MKKRILSLLLVAAMAVGMMVGCGKKDDQPTPSTQQQEQKETDAVESSTVVEEVDYDSLPTLNVLFTHGYAYESDENVIWREVAKTIGAKVHFIIADTDKRNTMIASGEGYDILAAMNADLLTLSQGGSLMPLDGLLTDECIEDMGPYIQDSLDRYSHDGKLYWLPYGSWASDDSRGDKTGSRNMIRWDLYKEMGAPEIKTLLDLPEVLAQMVEENPTNADGETAYALGIPSESTVMMNQMVNIGGPCLNQSNSNTSVRSFSFQDMSLVNQFDPENGAFFYTAKFYNECYLLGILDPDSFAMTEADMKAKMDAGTLYFTAFSWQYGSETPMMATPFTEDPITVTLKPSRARGIEAFAYAQAINAKTELKDQAVAYMNLIHTVDGCNWILNGLEGVHWEWVDGKRQYTDYAMELWNSEGHEDWYKEGLWHAEVHNMLGINKNSIIDDGQTLVLHEDASNFVTGLTAVEKDFCDFYGVDYPAIYYDKLMQNAGVANNKDAYVESFLPSIGSAPDDIKQLEGNVLLEAEQWVNKLVKAKEGEFEKVQADCLAALEKAGLSTVFKYYQDNWQAAFDKADEVRPN